MVASRPRGPMAAVVLALALSVGLAGCGSSGKAKPSGPSAATQVKANWTAFFNAQTPTNTRLALLQNGAQLGTALQAFATNPLAKTVSVNVTNVTVTGTTAKVTYQLLVGGKVQLPNATGNAVLQNGTWKVSEATLCGLLALTPHAPKIPGCTSG